MLDAHQHVPAQAPPLSQPYPPAPVSRPGPGGRFSGLSGIQRTPRVVAASFAVAVGLGVVIGLVTAPHAKHHQSAPAAAKTVDAKAAPGIPASTWGNVRQPGSALNVHMVGQTANRTALRYVYALKAGQSLDQVVIPSGKLYYGVVQGATAADDQFYAAGLVTVGGQAPTPVVWERKGSGAWRVSQSGPGSCDILPRELYGSGAWNGRPALCNG